MKYTKILRIVSLISAIACFIIAIVNACQFLSDIIDERYGVYEETLYNLPTAIVALIVGFVQLLYAGSYREIIALKKRNSELESRISAPTRQERPLISASQPVKYVPNNVYAPTRESKPVNTATTQKQEPAYYKQDKYRNRRINRR